MRNPFDAAGISTLRKIFAAHHRASHYAITGDLHKSEQFWAVVVRSCDASRFGCSHDSHSQRVCARQRVFLDSATQMEVARGNRSGINWTRNRQSLSAVANWARDRDSLANQDNSELTCEKAKFHGRIAGGLRAANGPLWSNLCLSNYSERRE
jgi:hypothetical protein